MEFDNLKVTTDNNNDDAKKLSDGNPETTYTSDPEENKEPKLTIVVGEENTYIDEIKLINPVNIDSIQVVVIGEDGQPVSVYLFDNSFD